METTKIIDFLAGDWKNDLRQSPSWCVNCLANLGDGHDCDNCAYCGTDSPEPISEVEAERELIESKNL